MGKKNKTRSCGIVIKCGKRYLMVHASKDWAPLLVDDGYWGFPKGIRDPEDGDDLSAAIRETFEETGIDLRNKRESIKKMTEYDKKDGKKTYVVYAYEDKDMALMNHKFYCATNFEDKDGVDTPEVDRYHWATKKEFKELAAGSHKKHLFPRKKDK